MKKNHDVRESGYLIPYQKVLKSMKLLLVFMLGACLTVQAYSQQTKVSFEYQQIALSDLLLEVANQTQIEFLYNHAALKDIKLENVYADKKEFTLLLDEILPRYGFDYVLREGDIVVIMKKTSEPQSQQQQSYTLKGKVVDEKGGALPGVTVLLKGSTVGTATDQKGEFTLRLPEGSHVLQFSFIGFQSQERSVSKEETLNIVLREAIEEMEEVVVTGIFTRRAESFTGSAQTITKEELRKVGNGNILQSLKNIDPSFSFVENLVDGSNPNVMPEIQLRGQSGFPDLKGDYQMNPNQPLFILDGFEVSLTKVIDLDMNRIESVTLLKDAAAKAIYGSKAANGVVVIETVRPAAGKMQVSYTGSLNLSMPDLTSYDLCNAMEKLTVEREGGIYTYSYAPGSWPERQYPYTEKYYETLDEVLRGVDTDWLSKPLRTGTGQKHSIYLEGGDEFLRYGMSVTYNNIKGVMKASNRNTFSGGITLSYRHKNFNFRDNLEVAYNKGDNSPWGAFSEYARMNPYLRPTDENGEISKICGEYVDMSTDPIYNPMWNSTINTKDYAEYTEIINNFYAEWMTPLKGMKVTGRVGLSQKNSTTEQFFPASHTMFINYAASDAVRRGSYMHGDGNDFSLSMDVNMTYSTYVKEHFFFTNVGWNMNNRSSRSTAMRAEGFQNDQLDDISFARQYAKNERPTGSESTTRDVGVLAVLNYSYADRYLFDASYRSNGSSQFGKDSRWGQFWSLGIGWNIHHEAFAKNLSFIDQWKLRGSLGFTGSQNFNSYQSKATYTYSNDNSYDGRYGAYLLGMENESLRWQRKYDQNIGMDISLLNRRLAARFEYYVSNTDDLLTDVTIPSSTGFLSYKENLGEVQNKGIEFRLSYRVWADKNKRDFLNFYVSGSHNSNKIRKISNSLASFNEEQTSVVSRYPVSRYEEGQSMNAIWVAPSHGIDPSSGRDIFIKPNGEITFTWSADNLAVCGDTEPDLRGNCGFNLDYKGFSLNVGMTWQFGGQIYNNTLVEKVENANLRYNVDRRIFSQRWMAAGDVTLYKDIKSRATTRVTQRFVENYDEWTLSSLNLSYDLDRIPAIKETGIRRLRLSFDMNDVCRISSVKIERGTAYPFARSFSFSLQASF